MYNKFNNKSPCQGTKNDFGVQYYIDTIGILLQIRREQLISGGVPPPPSKYSFRTWRFQTK